jgi:myo-inositol-1(or 4)-monophosphatase
MRNFSNLNGLCYSISKAVQNTTHVIIHDFNELAHLQSHSQGLQSFQDHATRVISKQLAQSLERSYKRIPVLIDVPDNVDDMGFEAFVITPLNGVDNFMRHMNHFVTAVSYFKKGQFTAMLMFNPITNESFGAYNGCGAFYNQARMRVSKRLKYPK